VAADTPPPGNDAISFQHDVQPIFNQICVKCHGGEEVKEGLSLKSYAEVMRGSDNGPIVVPGDPANSFLIEQIVKGEMPKRGPKLLPAQIRAITAWVEAGAPDN
jgi:mono/diheme cytochrome c family protein